MTITSFHACAYIECCNLQTQKVGVGAGKWRDSKKVEPWHVRYFGFCARNFDYITDHYLLR